MILTTTLSKSLRFSLRKLIPNQLFCTNGRIINPNQQTKNVKVEQRKLKSIMPLKQQGYAYGHYFPKNWSEQYIKKVLDPNQKDIQKIQIVKTSVGQHSGKVLIKFKNQKVRIKYIEKYNQDYIMTDTQSQRVVILPFDLKNEEKKKQNIKGKNYNNPVRISNLDFDITELQLRKIAAGYGQISFIQLNLRQSGINRGFATIYFQKRIDAQQFKNFINDFTYRDRKLKGHLTLKLQKKKQLQFLQVPTFTFQANIELMRKLKAKQYEYTQNKAQ